MEKEKQLREFNFHGLKLIGVYNPKLDSWWFIGKEVYKCLGVSKAMFSHYMRQVEDKHKTKLNNTKVNEIFVVKKSLTTKKVDNHYETLISESGLYMMASCLGKTEQCKAFRKFVFEDLLVSLRKAEQKTLEEQFDTQEEEIARLRGKVAGLEAELAYWESKRKQARYCLTDNRKNPKHKSNGAEDDWRCMYENY